MKNDPHEIERWVTLSLVLEPIAEKEGCTTRTKDLSETTKLQYFLASGVNVGKYFFQLAERVQKVGGQPETFWDIALRALKDSNRNTASLKYINHGLLDLLFPVVLASLLTDEDGHGVCKGVVSVFKNSSAADARYRDEYRTLALSTSRREFKRSFRPVGGENLFEHHTRWLKMTEEADYRGGVLWFQEFLTGLPMLQKMYAEAKKHTDAGLLVALEKSFPVGVEHISGISAGFVADYSAATAYLLLRDNPDTPIIR